MGMANIHRVISYGGGVQSTALCVLAVQGKLDDIMGGPVEAALFANTGDKSEHPDTLRYVREVMVPWAESHGLSVIELQRLRAGIPEDLWDATVSLENKSIPLPVKLSSGAYGNRSCTAVWKIDVVNKWLRQQGCGSDARGAANGRSKLSQDIVDALRTEYASGKVSQKSLCMKYGVSKAQMSDILSGKSWRENDSAVIAIGISTDEIQRVNNSVSEPWQQKVFPLIDLGLSRDDCYEVIADAGLPVPQKSSCFFCPFHSKEYWVDLESSRPDLFERAVFLEEQINVKRELLGKDQVTLTFLNSSLADGVAGDGKCDSGYCFT